MAQTLAQALTRELAKFPQLDPRAVLAVAAQEGLGGGVGDAGTSFGPQQLHFGGAYPAFAPHDPALAQQWAWSPQGIDYALQQDVRVAGGLHGAAAVDNIVRRFERPANPDAEVAGALHAYGLPAAAGTSFQIPTSSTAMRSPGSTTLAAAATPARPPIAAPILFARRMLGGGYSV